VCVRACYGRPVHLNDVVWVPFSHDVAHSHVVGVGDGLQIWNVDVKILNKQSRTANGGVVFQFRWCAVTSHSRVRNVTGGLGCEGFLWNNLRLTTFSSEGFCEHGSELLGFVRGGLFHFLLS
jgi:hypothetical protein